MAKWFGAHYNQEVRFSLPVKCKKGHQVFTSRSLIKDEIIIINYFEHFANSAISTISRYLFFDACAIIFLRLLSCWLRGTLKN